VPIALTRPPGAALARCELSYKVRDPIDLALAAAQHAEYERVLESLGATVVRLPAEDDHPDAVFVEDVAVVLDEAALVTRPGTASRRGETLSMARALAHYRPVHHMLAPATLDGGDVMRIGRTLYVGRSARTNEAGVESLRDVAEPFGYEVVAVPVNDCLHLKTACTYAGARVVLANPAWVDASALRDVEVLHVPEEEPWGASVLSVGGALVLPASFPRTRDLLESRGFETCPVDLSELQKAEGGPTCLSVLVEGEAAGVA
jgi:dimethylargininase